MRIITRAILRVTLLLGAGFICACSPTVNGAPEPSNEVHENVPELPISINDVKGIVHGCKDGELTNTPGWSFVVDGFGHGPLTIELRTFAGGRAYATTTLDFRGQIGDNETEIIPAIYKGQIVGETYIWVGGPDGPLFQPDAPYELHC